jgi:hypothetical protein
MLAAWAASVECRGCALRYFPKEATKASIAEGLQLAGGVAVSSESSKCKNWSGHYYSVLSKQHGHTLSFHAVLDREAAWPVWSPQ